MREPLSRFFAPLQPSRDSWMHRVRDNFHQLLTPTRIFTSSANGAPIHLVRVEKSASSTQAQGASILSHAVIIGVVLILAMQSPVPKREPPLTGRDIRSYLPLPPRLLDSLRGHNPNGGSGSGSGHDTLPPTQGNLPSRSSIQLLKPTLPRNPNPEVPIPPTILDPSASRNLMPVPNIGLPWMHDPNNSSGPGKGNTIGDGPGDSIGSSSGDQAGVGGPPGFYQPGVVLPRCGYCPDPQYTDEAREAKLQGTVTLQVLVGADGRAAQIRIVRGIGMGLDDRAVQSVRGWKFIPARDAARRAVPAWVTVEAVFRLF
jgi:periplasmic protein TonB